MKKDAVSLCSVLELRYLEESKVNLSEGRAMRGCCIKTGLVRDSITR